MRVLSMGRNTVHTGVRFALFVAAFFLLLIPALAPAATPLLAQEPAGSVPAAAQEAPSVTDLQVSTLPAVSPYNRSFFVVSNLSLWFLWAILIIVTVILISLRKILFERAVQHKIKPAAPEPAAATPAEPPPASHHTTPLVEPKKVVTIKVRKITKRKPKQHVS